MSRTETGTRAIKASTGGILSQVSLLIEDVERGTGRTQGNQIGVVFSLPLMWWSVFRSERARVGLVYRVGGALEDWGRHWIVASPYSSGGGCGDGSTVTFSSCSHCVQTGVPATTETKWCLATARDWKSLPGGGKPMMQQCLNTILGTLRDERCPFVIHRTAARFDCCF